MKPFTVIPPLFFLLIFSIPSLAIGAIDVLTGDENTVSVVDGIVTQNQGKALNDRIRQQLKHTGTRADFTVKINTSLPQLHFSLHGTYSGEGFKTTFLEYREVSSTTLHRIDLKEVTYSKDLVEGNTFRIVEFIDINFDGYLDLRVFDTAGPTGDLWQTFLYDSTTGKYVYNKDISQLPTLAVDARNKRLYSCRKTGPCREDLARYLIKNDILHLEKVVWAVPGFLNNERKLVTFGKELDKLQRQQQVVSYCVRTVAVPRTKSVKYKDINSPNAASSNFRIVALSYENAFDLIMKDMPNEDVKERLWFYHGDMPLYYDL